MGEAEVDLQDATQSFVKSPSKALLKKILMPIPSVLPILESTFKEMECDFHPEGKREQQQIDLTSVMEKLLLMLPIQSFLRSKTICKVWNSIMCSSFLPLWLETSHQDRCLLMGYPDGRQVMAISDAALACKWHCSIPPRPPFLCFTQQVSAIHPVASDGGLIVYVCQGFSKRSTTLCVFNPLTGSYCMLPPIDLAGQGVSRSEILIVTNGISYMVYVVGFTRKPNRSKAGIMLNIYDSISRSWARRGITPEDDSIAPGHWSAVLSKGVLYILSHVDGVISYNQAQDVWGRVGTPLREIYVNGWLVHEKLLLHNGCLLLIGTTLERDEYTDELLHRLYIYELRTQPGYGNSPYVHWDQFDRMPDELMQSIHLHAHANHKILPPDELLEAVDPQTYAEHNILPVSCYQCEDLVLLRFHDESSTNNMYGSALVAYRLSTKTWTRILRWNAVAMQQDMRKEMVSGGAPQVECGLSRATFNVVGFKPSLAATH